LTPIQSVERVALEVPIRKKVNLKKDVQIKGTLSIQELSELMAHNEGYKINITNDKIRIHFMKNENLYGLELPLKYLTVLMYRDDIIG